MTEAHYNCPTCRWNCPPGARDELCMARGEGARKIQTKHCDYWEEADKP